ncbi:MAG: protein kinase family protein [Propionibacteriaceae bacterium]|nr:protein kinase family protein [Propionibacteriaceae bacterium]
MPIKTRTMVSFGETAEAVDDPTEATPITTPQPAVSPAGHVLRGRYRLDEIVGHRVEGQTWRAFDVLLTRPVLVHLLPADRPNDAVLAAAKRAALVSDFRVLRVLDATVPADPGAWDESWVGPFVVCEYAQGRSVGDLLSAGPLSALEAGWLTREVADALAGMHARGLAHQRLSPDTVVVTDTGNVKIAGFLIAPEGRAEAQLHDPEGSDVRALGKLLYALLAGRWPGDSAGRLDSPRQLQPSVPASLDQICQRILAPSPDAGLRTATEISAALTRVLGTADAAQDLEQRVQGVAPAPAEPIDRASVQPVARRAVLPLVLIAMVGALIVAMLQLIPSTEDPDEPATAAPATQWPVVAAKDFDPEGNGEEHPREVSRAWDGNPATSWTTMNYFESDIGNKTGVGLVFDLGEVRQVSRVELELNGNGTSLEVRLPNFETTTAPLGSVGQWRTIGTATGAPADSSIDLDQSVQTRFVLIYLTELPSSGSQFTGGIAEARFWG